MTNLRQSENFAKFMKLSGWMVEKAGSSLVYIRKIPLLPPLIMKIQYPQPPIPLVQIEKLAKKYHPLKIQIQPIKIEPGFKKYGYKPSKEAGHVTKTIQLDLTQSEEKILAQMKKDARCGIKKAIKKGTKVQRYKDTKCFRRAWRKAVGWQRYVPFLKTLRNLKKAFDQKALFLLAESRKDTPGVGVCPLPEWRKKYTPHGLVAGTIVLITHSIAYYYYAFTAKEGRKNFSQYLLVWEAIKLAKKKGCRVFDFEGIYDPRFPLKSWQGFSHFKKSFGGKEIEYPGCWVRYKILSGIPLPP